MGVVAVSGGGRGRRLSVGVRRRSVEPRGGRPDRGAGGGGGGAAGAGEDAPLLRREPAQPARDADLRGRGLPRPGAAAGGRGGVLPRAARRASGRARCRMLWVPQWHPGGHGLHVHFAVGRYVPRGLIERAWGHGFVHIKLLDGLPVGSGDAGGGAAGGALPGRVRRPRARGRAPAGGAASLRGRAGLPAGRRSSATARRPRT